MNGKIYDVRDISDGDVWYSCGVFELLEDAVAGILGKDATNETVSEETTENYEEIAVYERELGFSGEGTLVFKVKREELYNEETDTYYWESVINDITRGD